ncbi:MAG: hypothetical protein V3U92_14660 [Cellulophaga sp.]
MKFSFLKSFLLITLLVVALFIIGSSCNSPDPTPTPQLTCDDSEPILESIFTALASPASMDLQQHEYKFTSAVAGEICFLGYQSLMQTTPFAIDNTTISYTLEIVGGPSVTQVFSSTSVEYVALPTPFAINAGQEYTIRRTGGDGLNSSTGYISNVPSFPVTNGNITFTSSNFIDVPPGGGPLANFGIPKIYFRFLE